MVFENIVVSILKKYVGKYLKNFDTDNFSLGLWKGNVSLIDLELKEEALLEYDLPVAINGGYIGKLSLEIPWSSMFTSPVVVRVTDVLILAGPQAEKPYDEEKEEKTENAIKQKQLRVLMKGSQTNVAVSNTSEDDTFTEKLTAQIIKNLQIYISNVHIRYEDSSTCPKFPFAIGITLANATAVTATVDWLPTFVDGSARQIYKLIELKSFAIYWNSNATLLLKGNQNWKGVMKSQISRSEQKDLHHEYLLRPLLLTLRLSIDQNAKVLMDEPKFVLNVLLDNLSLELTKRQVEGMLDLVDMFELMQVNQQYRKYRPQSSAKEHPKQWWRYAFQSYNETKYLPWTWKRIKKHREVYHQYVEKYLEKLLAINQDNKTKEVSDVLKKLEEHLDVVNILLARKQAEVKFNRIKETLPSKEKASEPVGWLEWFGIVSQSESSDDEDEERKSENKAKGFSLDDLSEKDKDELYKAINYVDDKTHPVYSKTYIRSLLSFHLKQCDISLKDSNPNSHIVTFKLERLYTALTEKPGSDSYSIKLNVNNVNVSAFDNTKDVIKASGDEKENLLVLNAEVNPTEVESDYLLSVYTQPIDIFYDQDVAKSIQRFFTTKHDLKLKQLEVAAGETIEEISKASRAGIQHAISRNKSIYFDIKLKSPTIILPQTKGNNEVFQIYFGDLSAKTILQKRIGDAALREAAESDLESMFYHQTHVVFSNMHFKYGSFNQDKGLLSTHHAYIIQPLCFQIDLFQCIESGYSNFPDFKIVGMLGSFEVYLSEHVLVQLYQMLNYFFPADGHQTLTVAHSSSQSSKRRSSSVVSKNDILALQDMIGASSTNQDHAKSAFNEKESQATETKSGEGDATSNYDSSIALFDRTKLTVHCEIAEVSIVYSIPKDDDEDFLLVSTKGLIVDMKSRIWDLSIKAQLRSFHLKDLINSSYYSKGNYILNSMKSQDLIQISCVQASPDGPAFKSKFEQTETKLEVCFGTINVQMEQETLRELNFSLKALSLKLDAANVDDPDIVMKKSLEPIIEDDNDAEAKKTLTKVEDVVMDKINLNVNLNVESVCMVLSTEGKQMAEFKTTDFSLFYLTSATYTELETNLREITFQDLLTSKMIVQGLADKVIKGKVLMNTNIPRESLMVDYDILFRFNKLDVYFDIDFFANLLGFYNSIDIEKSEQSTTPTTHVKNRSTFPKIKADISIDAPNLTILKGSHSNRCYLFDFGKICVKNDVVHDDENLISKADVSIEDVSLVSFIEEESASKILMPINLNIALFKPLNDPVDKLNANVSLPKFEMSIYENDLENFISIYNESIKKLSPSEERTEEKIVTHVPIEENLLVDEMPFELTIDANLDEFDVKFYSSEKDEPVEVLLLTISTKKLSTKIFQNQSLLKTNVSLNRLFVIEKINKQCGNDGFVLIQLAEDEDMLSLSYASDKTTSKNDLSVVFSKTMINLNASSLLNVKNYVEKIQEIMKELNVADSNQSSGDEITSKEISATSQHIDVLLADVVVTLYKTNMATAVFEMKGLNSSFEQHKDSLIAKAQLNFLKILDCDVTTKYPVILSAIDEKLISIELNQDKEIKKNFSNTEVQVNSICIKIGRLNMVFLYKFINNVMLCIEPLTTIQSSSQPYEKSDDEVDAIPQLIMLDIDIESPTLSIPKTSCSNEHLLLNMGRIVINNKLEVIENEKNMLNMITMNINNARVSILNMGGPTESIQVTNNLCTSISLHQPTEQLSNQLQIYVSLQPIEIYLSDDEIVFLMHLFQTNMADAEINEGKDLPKTGSYEKNKTSNDAMVYEIALNIDRVDLFLTSCDILKDKMDVIDGKPVEMCQISASVVKSNLNLNSDKMKIDFRVAEVVGYDRRPFAKGIHKKFLGKGRIGSEKTSTTSSLYSEQISMVYCIEDTDASLTLDINGTCLNLNVDLLHDINGYINGILHTDQIPVASESTEQPDNPAGKLAANFNINDTTVIVLQMPTVDPSPALLTHVTANMSYRSNNRSTDIDVTNCLLETMYGNFPPSKNRPKTLLHPCRLKCRMTTELPDIMNVDLKVDRMKFCMSPAILASIIQITDNLFQKEDQTATPKKEEKFVDWSPQLIDREDYLQNESMNAEISLHPQQNPDDGENTKQKAIVAFDVIDVILGNDYQGSVIPLLKGKFSARTKVTNWMTWPSFEGDFTAQMSYYNVDLGIFEPLLEPKTSPKDYDDPFELNIRVFYGESEKLNFSTRAMINTGSSDVTDSVDDVIGNEQEASEDEDRALFLVVSSEEEMELTVTSQSIPILLSLSENYSVESLRNSKPTKLVAPLSFNSMLGIKTTVFIDSFLSASKTKSPQLTIEKKSNRIRAETLTPSNMASSPHSRGSIALIKPRHLADSHQFSYSTSALEKLTGHDDDFNYQNECCNYSIDVKIDGFDPVKDVSVKTRGMFAYTLYPPKNGFVYRLVVEVKIESGQRLISLASNWMIHNHLLSAIVIHTDDDGLLNIPAKEEKSLPLLKTNTHSIGVSIQKFRSEDDVNSGDVENDEKLFVLTCHAQDNASEKCFVKMTTKSVTCMVKNQLPTSVQKINILPPVCLQNHLPYDIIYKLTEIGSPEKLQTGHSVDLLLVDPAKDKFELFLQMTVGDVIFEGKCNVDVSSNIVETITMKCSSNNQAPFTLLTKVETKENSCKITCYSQILLVNKTGLPLFFKTQDHFVYELPREQDGNGINPTLINVAHKKTRGSLRLEDGAWSDMFLVNTIGDEFSLNCKSKDSQNHYVHVGLQLSNTAMTHIVTISPRYFVANQTGFTILFKENSDGSKEYEVDAEKCMAVWVNEPNLGLRIKESTGAYIGNAFPWEKNGKYAKRLSNGETITVVCSHVGDRFLFNITPYQEGCIPLRVDNFCPDVSVFLQQKDSERDWERVEILATHAQFYNWSDLDKPCLLSFISPTSSKILTDIDVTMDGHGKIEIIPAAVVSDNVATTTVSCCSCCPWPCHGNPEDENQLLISDNETVESRFIFWVCRFEGAQRVLAFTWDPILAKMLRKNIDVEYVNTEVFLSLRGIGLSLVNSEPREIIYASITGGASVWEMEVESGRWEQFPVDVSIFLEDSFKNSVMNANYENKYQIDFKEMILIKPKKCKVRRTIQPALWVQYSQSKHNTSLHAQVHRLQVDSQQPDVTFPTVLYPSPIPARIIKRNGMKPFLEFSLVMAPQQDVTVVKYFMLLVQEFNVKLDRDIVSGTSSLLKSATEKVDESQLVEKDRLMLAENIHDSINVFATAKSNNLLIQYLHLSPMKIHLSFSLEGRLKANYTSEEELFEWLISTVGIHFTDISDAEIKLAYFERRNILVSQSMLVADFSKHYTLQAVKQFHKLVLGLDVIGNPYGLVSEYGRGFKDLFYEPYMGVVAGPHQFAVGLVEGVRSLLGHTIGGTFGAASLITGQLGQVLAALTFDSEYKRRRRREMARQTTGFGGSLAVGGKQFVLGFVFGISGVVTKPVQGARQEGIEGFFKGVGKGIMGLLVKPTGGVIDLVTSSLDGVKRFAEQEGEDVVCRVRLPRVAYPGQALEVFSKYKAYGFGLFRSMRVRHNIQGRYLDYAGLPDGHHTVFIFTTKSIVFGKQRKFFDDWQIDWEIEYEDLDNIEKSSDDIIFKLKETATESVSHSLIVPCILQAAAKLVFDKCSFYLHQYRDSNL